MARNVETPLNQSIIVLEQLQNCIRKCNGKHEAVLSALSQASRKLQSGAVNDENFRSAVADLKSSLFGMASLTDRNYEPNKNKTPLNKEEMEKTIYRYAAQLNEILE